MDDRQLVEAVLAGEPGAFRQLYDRHVRRVYGLALRVTRNPDLAEECTQEAFIRAVRYLSSFRGDAAFSTWLHRVALSATHDVLRRERRHSRREVDMEDGPEPISLDRHRDPHLRRRLAEAIEGLPEVYRDVFVLYYIEDQSHAEISEALDIPVGTAKRRLSVAREKLREVLSDLMEETE